MALGWGIISTAGIADEDVAPAIAALEDAELVGVTSRDLGRAQDFAGRHGARLATTRLDELLADPGVDIVYVATPNAAHAEEVQAAAASGKHVFCEKPLGTSVGDAEAAVEACRAAGVKLGVDFQSRFYAPCVEIHDLVRGGAIGDVLRVECSIAPGRIPLRSWRTDRHLAGLGTMNNLGVHAYDLVRWVLGSEVVEATALLDTGRSEELETTALALLRYENGTLAYVVASQAAPHFRADLALYGSEGRIVGRSVTRPNVEGELSVVIGDDERVTLTSTAGGFESAVAAFQQAVVTGEEPSPSGLDGLRSAELTDALARSAREGRTVEVARP